MNETESNIKKFKRPKQSTNSTTQPECSRPRSSGSKLKKDQKEPLCPLLAKDSEWVDIVQSQIPETSKKISHSSDEEEVLQLVNLFPYVYKFDAAILVECEESPDLKPLAIMFPGLLERDPQTLEGVLNRAMSTTEVTKHLVDLGQKANFKFMKKANRLIPPDKKWLESVTEDNNSRCSMESGYINSNISSDYDDDDIADGASKQPTKRRLKKRMRQKPSMIGEHDSSDGARSTITEEEVP